MIQVNGAVGRGRPWAAVMVAVAVAASGLAVTPAASSVTVEAGRLHSTEVCFTVHIPGDPRPQDVAGTLFATDSYSAGETALLLLHAGFAERSSWDGAWPSVEGAASVARPLATAGYGVFTVDRLGHGDSEYGEEEGEEPAGLTMTAQVEMAKEMVEQIRHGSFRLKPPDVGTCADGAADGRGAARVVLMGYSSGAALTELYATRHHNVAGIVALMWSNQGFSNAWKEHYSNTIGPQVLAGETESYYLFEPGPDGYSKECEELLFYVEGIREHQLERLCGMGYYADKAKRTSPTGEGTVLTVGAQMQANIGLVGPTPALLVFADNDAAFTDYDSGGNEPDLVKPEIEMWRQRCNCSVSVVIQKNAGHAGWFHDSVPEIAKGIVEWIGRGFKPEPGDALAASSTAMAAE